jgi:hypothetical protein
MFGFTSDSAFKFRILFIFFWRLFSVVYSFDSIIFYFVNFDDSR